MKYNILTAERNAANIDNKINGYVIRNEGLFEFFNQMMCDFICKLSQWSPGYVCVWFNAHASLKFKH